MNQPIEPNLQKLWLSFSFDIDRQIHQLHYEYKHLGYDYPQIFTTRKLHLLSLVENTFYQFMIARFGHLFSFFDQELIERSDKAIKEQYNKLFVSLQYGKKQKMNTVLVIVAVIIGRLVQRVFPNVVYNERLTIEIMHCLIVGTLGIMVGDNSIKYMIGKEIGARQLTRFLFRQMFQKKILIAKIKQIQQQKQWPQLKKLFYNPPSPPPQKKPFDQGVSLDKPEQGFARGLGSYHLKSIQMSRAFLNSNQTFKLKQSTLKKYACKMNVSLECNSNYYKPIKKMVEEQVVSIKSQEKKQVFSNKKNLKYWERYLSNFKNSSSEIVKEKFPPVKGNEEHRSEHSSFVELPMIPTKLPQNDENKIQIENEKYKQKNKHDSRIRNKRDNLSVSLHEKKEQDKNESVIKYGRVSKVRAPGRTVLLKNQSKIFYESRLQMGDGEALSSQLQKMSFIR